MPSTTLVYGSSPEVAYNNFIFGKNAIDGTFSKLLSAPYEGSLVVKSAKLVSDATQKEDYFSVNTDLKFTAIKTDLGSNPKENVPSTLTVTCVDSYLSVGHGRECGYDGLPLAEAFGVQLGIGPAEARADDHAELAGAAKAHDKLIAERFGVGRHELHLQYALEIGSDGVLQRGPFQPPIALGGAGRVAFDPFGVAFRHFGEHTAHGGPHLIRRFRHDAECAG